MHPVILVIYNQVEIKLDSLMITLMHPIILVVYNQVEIKLCLIFETNIRFVATYIKLN